MSEIRSALSPKFGDEWDRIFGPKIVTAASPEKQPEAQERPKGPAPSLVDPGDFPVGEYPNWR